MGLERVSPDSRCYVFKVHRIAEWKYGYPCTGYGFIVCVCLRKSIRHQDLNKSVNMFVFLSYLITFSRVFPNIKKCSLVLCCRKCGHARETILV